MTLRFQADYFLNAYHVLHENNQSTIATLEKAHKQRFTEEQVSGSHLTLGVDIVCLAFSVELYIKNLHYVTSGEILHAHDILKLFMKLPKHIQQEIFACDSICQNPFFTRGNIYSSKTFTNAYSAYDGFIDQIKAISDGFTKWRYSYENTSLQYDTSFALAFIEALQSSADSN